jgi:hypothetical protein
MGMDIISLCGTSINHKVYFLYQVGAIILYTYVYQMFAPPPEGFDAEEENLALKTLPVDAAPEQVPLLTQNFPKDFSPTQDLLPVQSTEPRGRGVSRKGKVGLQLWNLYSMFQEYFT